MKLYSINALAEKTGADRRTLKKYLADVPAAKVEGKSKLYRLADVERVLAEHAQTESTTDQLKDAKLREEVRKLRLRNDREEGKLIDRSIVAAACGKTYGEASNILRQKLEYEGPAMCVGLDMNGIRTKLVQVLDDVRAQFRKLAELWPEGS